MFFINHCFTSSTVWPVGINKPSLREKDVKFDLILYVHDNCYCFYMMSLGKVSIQYLY